MLSVLNIDIKIIDGEKTPWLTKTEYHDEMKINWIGVTDTTIKINFYKTNVEKAKLLLPLQFNKIDSSESVVLNKALQLFDNNVIDDEQKKITNIIGFVRANNSD